jgi:hypothetical protein
MASAGDENAMALAEASRDSARRFDRGEFFKEACGAFLALGFIVWAVYVAGAAIWFTSIGCDESCYRPAEAPDWTHYVNSWQWHAIRLLGFAQLGLAAIAVALAYRKAKHFAFLALALHLVALLVLVSIRASGEGWDFTVSVVAAFLVAEAAGLSAVALLARERRLLRRPT